MLASLTIYVYLFSMCKGQTDFDVTTDWLQNQRGYCNITDDHCLNTIYTVNSLENGKTLILQLARIVTSKSVQLMHMEIG